jgi:hypothetical protein
LVTRAPPQGDGFDVGPITAINLRPLNFASAYVEAYDWAVDYTVKTGRLGSFNFAGSATQRVHNQIQATPLSGRAESVGQYVLPRWSANAALTWQLRGTTFSWFTQYHGPYFYSADHSVDLNQGRAEASSAFYHDFSVSRRFGQHGASSFSWLSGTELLLGIKNVFNTAPRIQVENGMNSFDSRVDPRLASYYVTVRKAF